MQPEKPTKENSETPSFKPTSNATPQATTSTPVARRPVLPPPPMSKGRKLRIILAFLILIIGAYYLIKTKYFSEPTPSLTISPSVEIITPETPTIETPTALPTATITASEDTQTSDLTTLNIPSTEASENKESKLLLDQTAQQQPPAQQAPNDSADKIRQVVEYLKTLHISSSVIKSNKSLMTIDGQVYKIGDVINPRYNLKWTKIDEKKRTVSFVDDENNVYVKKL